MINLYLDAFLFSCPQEDTASEDFETFIRNIVAWEELKHIPCAKVYLSEKADEVLCNTNTYPWWESIEKLMQKFAIKYLQTKDIYDVMQVLLQNTTRIEKKLRIKEILSENVKSKPYDHLEERHELFQEHHNLLLSMMSLACHVDGEKEEHQNLVTRDLKKDSTPIKISGKIIDFEFYDPPRSIKIPYIIKGRFNACANKNGLYLTLDPIAIWKESDSKADYRKALEIYLYQYICKLKRVASEREWTFGSRFFEMARNLGFLDDSNKIERLFRACAETALGQTLKATHQLRTGSGAADPQRKRNQDGAWRRDIDRQYHLHYWETAKGPEFASVVIHDDMSIPE